LSSRPLIALPLLLLAVACGDAGRAGEIACQQRLVEVGAGPAGGPGRLGGGFAELSRNYARMPLDGCNEGQRHSAAALARVTAQLAAAFGRLGDPIRRMEQDPGLRGSQDFLELQSLIEQFEGRRQILRRDLERMRRESRQG
jgi:hypothetical protein